ncbi:hypothetical protein [Cypionkella sp.]|uniref:hypothetical protein n=1 Tax=Cypionkella sp. TaxID=2811411 RepID=UPI002605BB16|nr:hypothetical protein [Cypionkella sp.]
MDIREKIKNRLELLEAELKAGKHLDNGNGKFEVENLVANIAKFFSVLSDTDRDFINAARHAIDVQVPWS